MRLDSTFNSIAIHELLHGAMTCAALANSRHIASPFTIWTALQYVSFPFCVCFINERAHAFLLSAQLAFKPFNFGDVGEACIFIRYQLCAFKLALGLADTALAPALLLGERINLIIVQTARMLWLWIVHARSSWPPWPEAVTAVCPAKTIYLAVPGFFVKILIAHPIYFNFAVE